MIQHHVHIRSTDQFNQVGLGVHEKNDRNEINSVDAYRVWMCIRVTFSSSIRKVFGLPADWFVLNEFEVLSAVFSLAVGCGSTFASPLPIIPQSP